jgi:hypothetical protein
VGSLILGELQIIATWTEVTPAIHRRDILCSPIFVIPTRTLDSITFAIRVNSFIPRCTRTSEPERVDQAVDR